MEIHLDDYARYRLMKKGLRRRFGTVGWVLMLYMVIMNVAVIATMVSQVIMQIQRSALAGKPFTPEMLMENLPDGAGGYIGAVIIGLLLLFIWKKPDFWKNEIFAKGKPMTFGNFFRILCVFLSGQLIYQLLMSLVEMVLNAFGLSILAGMQAVSMDTDNFIMFLYAGILAPITEELLKAFPILFFAVVVSDKRETLFTASMATGIGFAILENAYYLIVNYQTFSFLSALVRGFGTGLMHGMCTLLVGFGISFIRKRRKLFAVGTFALLSTAITYHSMFNMLVQSAHPSVGALLPLLTYCPFFIWRWVKKKDKSKRAG